MSSFEYNNLLLLTNRLERISADSYWAHRASGMRGALLEILENMEMGKVIDEFTLSHLSQKGYQILEFAARNKS